MKTKILITLLSVSILTSLLMNLTRSGDPEKPRSGNEKLISDFSKAVTQGTKVLQIDLSGGIFYISSSPGSLKQIIRQIDNAAQDEETRGLFIRANSPGGSIAASQELYEAVKRFQETGKPIITSVMDICASGCYYATLPSTTVIANRGSLVGSIGVIMTTVNMEELYKKIGIKRTSFTSVKNKDMFSPARTMTPEEKAHVQKIISKMHEDFVSDVVHWRKQNTSEASLRRTANGMLYTSDMALTRGLIDKIGDLRAAQEEMAQILGVPRKDIRFVKPAYQYWEDFLGLQVMEGWGSIFSGLRSLLEESPIENIPQLQY